MSRLGVLLPLLLLATSCRADPTFGSTVRPMKEADTATQYRLPQIATPQTYDIELSPDLKKHTFTGDVKIVIKVLEKSTKLTLNAKNLTIDEKDIKLMTQPDGDKEKPKDVQVTTHLFDDEKQFLIINLKEELVPNKSYTLTIKFSGVLNDQLRGFYRSSYMDKDGKEVWLATTHFEPIGARLAFPCWDEPAYKAKFKITIRHLKTLHAISNTEETDKIADGADHVKTYFKQTPLMSTYLVAFVVSDYKNKENKEKSFRVWTKPQAVNSTDYALEFGQKVLKELDEYTAIKFSKHIPKMDQISIPDFSAGAMENWGLVTYKEYALLFEEGVTTTRAKQGIATVIAHEFAHQWFGNLVSPQWWKYLWLNEGFATYFQYLSTNRLEPKWRLEETLVVDAMQGVAFVRDAGENVHAMNHDAYMPKNIQAMFNYIAYQKAGSVIRMMEHILTKETFQKALRKYLSNNELGVVEPKDLFDAIEGVEKDSNIKKIMNEWINEPGYPVVNVNRDKDGVLKVTQERFSFAVFDNKTKWWVPLTYTTEDKVDFTETKPTEWLKPDGKSVDIKDTDSTKWVIFNKQQAGYYRVNYDNENWDLIIKHLNGKKYDVIHQLNRAQLIDDSLALARAGKLKYSKALSLAMYLHQEKDYIPWVSSFRNLNFLDNMLDRSEKYDIFKLFVKYVLESLVKTVKFEAGKDDEHVNKLIRGQMVKWACLAEMKECTEFVEQKFKSWLDDSKKNELDVDLKNDILCAAIRTADEKTWNTTLSKYKDMQTDEQKNSLVTALGCSEEPKILHMYISLALDPKQNLDFSNVFSAVISQSTKGVDVGLDALINSYEKIVETVKNDDKINGFVQKIGNTITTPAQYAKLGSFITRKEMEPEIQRDTLKTAGQNLDWIMQHEKDVEQWLEESKSKLKSSAATATFGMFAIVLSVFFTRLY